VSEEPSLRRSLTTVTLTLYGVGVMVGAGIYVLLGKIVGIAGGGGWLAFVAAALAALPTALCYAELSSRYPRSAGEAVFADRAFGRAWISFVVGFTIFASGVASVAALCHGFADYASALFELGEAARVPVIIAFLAALTFVNYLGIRESTWLNAVFTVLSVGALVVLIIAGVPSWSGAVLVTIGPEGTSGGGWTNAAAVVSAAALAYYAFIGFEDICNVAEEVEQPTRTIPRAILLSLTITALIYVGTAITAVCVVPMASLAGSSAPLVEISSRVLPGVSPAYLAVVALLAVSNTALFNLIMGSRMLWGMSRNGWLAPAFARVSERRRTPVVGIAVCSLMTLMFALTGVLRVLAESTNVIILAAFFMVDLSLLVVRVRGVPPDAQPPSPERADDASAHFRVPLIVPILGLVVTAYLITQFSAGAYLRAAALVGVGALLYLPSAVRRGPERGSATR
jgi:APA family basic amino acid/polyamine antiporter